MPSLGGLAGLLFLVGRGGGVDLGGGADLDLYSVLLGPFKIPCDQSLGYPDVSVILLAQIFCARKFNLVLAGYLTGSD